MNTSLKQKVNEYELNRRDFIRVASLSTAGFLVGCAANPVTGEKQLMLMSEQQEIAIDRQNVPHQVSADYGPLLDKELNNYIDRTGKNMAAKTHRPQMPYSFRGVNATYINAYAFPGGSIAVTRGILLAMENEAELASLLGHELGHVNARHTATRMSKSMITSTILAGVTAVVGTKNKQYASLAAGLGGIGAGMLLASYSRSDERQADSLGMEYMVKAGHNPNGMVGLMNILRSKSKHTPSAIEMMFSTHPMSDERYRDAENAAASQYRHAKNLPLNRERYMDHTARLRKKKTAIENMQKGENLMRQKKYPDAENHFDKALKQTSNDYTGLLLMAKCQYAQKNHVKAQQYAEKAKKVYPKEPQAYHISGLTKIPNKKYSSAYQDFTKYENMLPGNPNTIFLKGFSQEKMSHQKQAASEYMRYLKVDRESNQAKHAYNRLVEWGYVKQ